MIESLQQQAIPDVSGILLTVAILWGIWPVACGVIGAMRGQAIQGIVHGFLWGPFGILIVMLSGRKYECPTCGKKTLRQPYGQICPPGMPSLPPIVPEMARKTAGFRGGVPQRNESLPSARPAMQATPLTMEPAASAHVDQSLSADTNIPIPASTTDAQNVEEVEKLREWVNAD